MHASEQSNEWLSRVVSVLSGEGYTISRNVEFEGQEFLVAATLSEFKITKIGNSETFFVFKEFTALSLEDVRSFSSLAYRYAVETRAVTLPIGVFESVWSFGVCITENLSPAVAEAVKSKSPPKHFSAGEIPVVYDKSANQIAYFEGTPLWGAAYYQGFRKQIQKYLVFH